MTDLTTASGNALTTDLTPMVMDLALPTDGHEEDQRTKAMVTLARVLNNSKPPILNLNRHHESGFTIGKSVSVAQVQDAYAAGAKICGATPQQLNGAVIPDYEFLRQGTQDEGQAEIGFYLGAARAHSGDTTTLAADVVGHIHAERQKTLEKHCLAKAEWFVLNEPLSTRLVKADGTVMLNVMRDDENSDWRIVFLDGFSDEECVALSARPWSKPNEDFLPERLAQLGLMGGRNSWIVFENFMLSVGGKHAPAALTSLVTDDTEMWVPSVPHASFDSYWERIQNACKKRLTLWDESQKLGTAMTLLWFFNENEKEGKGTIIVRNLEGDMAVKKGFLGRNYFAFGKKWSRKALLVELGLYEPCCSAYRVLDNLWASSWHELPLFKEHVPKKLLSLIDRLREEHDLGSFNSFRVYAPDYKKPE